MASITILKQVTRIEKEKEIKHDLINESNNKYESSQTIKLNFFSFML